MARPFPRALRSPAVLARDLGGLALYGPGAPLVARIPRRSLALAARLGAGAIRRLRPADEREMRAELRLLFGDRPLPAPEDEIVREALRSALFNDLEVPGYPFLGPDTIDRACTIEGREHLDAALARGRGALVLIGHFGANQMIMPALGHKGYPMNQLSAPPTVWAEILRDTRTTPLWERVLARRWALEQRLPVRHVDVFRFLRPAYACLARNEVLGLAFDGGGGTRWTPVRILARTAHVSTQPAQLWRATGAALLPARVERPAGAVRHRIVLEPALEWQSGPGREETLRANMQAFADRFSTWVERRPEAWLPFLLLRRRVRATDARPLFDDYPSGDVSRDG
jgi:phosphatidylinositol dimannoside acyltransferase